MRVILGIWLESNLCKREKRQNQRCFMDNDKFAAPGQPGPVRLQLPRSRVWLSWVLLGGILLVALSQFVSTTLLEGDLPLALGAKDNRLIEAGQWWRLITPMFLHLNLVHLAFNAYALYVLGSEVESLYGTPRFAAIYLLAGLAGNVASFVFSPYPSAGASTALFGLIATELAFFYRNRDVLGPVGQRRLGNILVIVAINFAMGLSGAVDNFGHLGGFIGGALLGWLLCPQYQVAMAGPGNLPWIVDINSLQRAWRGVVLVALAIVAIACAVILARS
jgi:rhomboid protease GluP